MSFCFDDTEGQECCLLRKRDFDVHRRGLYDVYVEWCTNTKMNTFSFPTFTDILKEPKVGLESKTYKKRGAFRDKSCYKLGEWF